MKTISEYINGADPGDIIPSIKGLILKIGTSKSGDQWITIGDEGDCIKLVIPTSMAVREPLLGDVLSLVSTARKKESAKGLTLKEGKTSRYISVTAGASIEQSSVTESVEEPEPMTGADHAIDNYILDRLYIYGRCKRIVEQLDDSLPFDKLPELATAVHIELSKRGIAPRPDENQENRKKVHKERLVENLASSTALVEGKTPKESPKSGNWRDFVHPVSGVLLGSEGINKIAEVYVPWAIRQNDPNSLEKGPRELYNMVTEAARELGITPSKSFDAYLVKYINDYEPNSEKRRKSVVAKFTRGLEEEKIVADAMDVTDKEATYLLKNFKGVWNKIIESEEDEE